MCCTQNKRKNKWSTRKSIYCARAIINNKTSMRLTFKGFEGLKYCDCLNFREF